MITLNYKTTIKSVTSPTFFTANNPAKLNDIYVNNTIADIIISTPVAFTFKPNETVFYNGTTFVSVGAGGAFLNKVGMTADRVYIPDINTPTTGNLAITTVTKALLEGFDSRITTENTKNATQDTQIAGLTTQVTNLYELNADSLAIGDGTTPAISVANDANAKANKAYQFSIENTTANITLANGDVVGTTANPIEKGAILKIVKTSTGFGYTLIDSRDKEFSTIQFGFGLGASVVGQDLDTLERFNADAPTRIISGTALIVGTFPATSTTLSVQILGTTTDIATIIIPANQIAGILPITIVTANRDILTDTSLVLNTSQFVPAGAVAIALTKKSI